MQVELAHQLGLDLAADAGVEEYGVGHDNATASVRTAFNASHHRLQEQPGRLSGPKLDGEVLLDRLLLLAAEGRVGEHHVDAIAADLGQGEVERVLFNETRPVDAVQ